MVSGLTTPRLTGPDAPPITVDNMASQERIKGNGSPNGVFPGTIGQEYVDLDTRVIWVKTSDSGATTGWQETDAVSAGEFEERLDGIDTDIASVEAALEALDTATIKKTTIPTIYATDSEYGAVGDYSGHMTLAGTGTDNRAAIQAALDAAHFGQSSYESVITGTAWRVVLPKGKYYISAPTDGSPSLRVPSKVHFDYSEAELFFEIPLRNYTANGITEPNPAWCGILLGAMGGLTLGRAQIIWGRDQTYGGQWYGMTLDCIRVQESDGSRIVGGRINHHIFNFRGAGIRYIACINQYLSDVSIANCCYGVVMGYFGTAFSAAVTAGYMTRYRTGGTAAENVSTNLHINKCMITNIYRTAIFIGAAGDWNNPASASVFYGGLEQPNGAYAAQGGPISISDCSFENIAYGILYGNASIGALYMTRNRSEECGDNTISLGVIYGNALVLNIKDLTWGGTGTRSVTKASYTGANTSGVLAPTTFVRNDGVNCAPVIENVFISNPAGGCAFYRKSANARLPIVVNYRCNAPTQMQLTDSGVYNIIYKNSGHGIESLSTTGLAPNGTSETANGVRTTFTFADGFTKVKPDRIVVDGLILYSVDDGGTNWTWNSTTGVVTFTVAPVRSVRAFF